ncbi:MAG TPA: PVC-type heme-binding CxxCH protein, partial [Verrucomicrobiae bacterium]
VNGLLWGLDNWVYGANGRSEGEIRRPDDPPARAVSIRGHDFRFRPDTGEIEAIAERSQFGLARDDWGNRFLSWNTIAMRQEVLPERYLTRNPLLASTESVFDTAPPGETGQVFPLTPPPLTFNNESTSHFNALAGLTIYRGAALGPGYRGSAFLGETLRNLVHRRVLFGNGPRFTTRRGEGEQQKEFLASTDPWFHPVNFATGPDGALYVVDFYRRFVEHPDFVPAKLRGDVPWRAGAEHGRLWRIVSKEAKTSKETGPVQLRKASTAELVASLNRTNGWWRDTAQRLLVERQDRAAVPLLASALRTNAPSSPLASLHSLGALDGLGALSPELLIGAMKHEHFAVRVHAARLSEPFLSGKLSAPSGAEAGRLREAVFALAADVDARVRLQLILTLGEMDNGDRLPALTRLTRQAALIERWESPAILSSVGQGPWPFLKALLQEDQEWLRHLTVEQRRFLDQTARLVGAGHTEVELAEFFAQWVAAAPALGDRGQVALLAGLGDGLARSGQSLEKLLKAPPASFKDKAPVLSWLAQAPSSIALSAQEKVSDRLAGIRVLTLARPDFAGAVLLKLLESGPPDEIQAPAARGFMDLGDDAIFSQLFTKWTDQAPRAR